MTTLNAVADLAVKLTIYRTMPGWSIENEEMFMINLLSKMYKHLVLINKHPADIAQYTIVKFKNDVLNKMNNG